MTTESALQIAVNDHFKRLYPGLAENGLATKDLERIGKLIDTELQGAAETVFLRRQKEEMRKTVTETRDRVEGMSGELAAMSNLVMRHDAILTKMKKESWVSTIILIVIMACCLCIVRYAS